MKYSLEIEKVWQFDQGIRMIIPPEYSACVVQFYSREYPEGLAVNEYIVEDGTTYCNIPNQMLMYDSVITVYACRLETKRQLTESCTKIYVHSRPKPPDYVLDPTEVITYKTAEELINKLKIYENVSANAEDGEDVSASVTLTENGLEFHFVIPPGPQGSKGETGPQGEAGADGKDGYTPIKGIDYFDGTDGYTPQKGIDYFDGKDGQDGKDGANGYTPVKGTDYWTEEDIQDIRNYIDTRLGVIENGSY